MALVHNRAGANMAGGVASTLLAAARRGGTIDGELGLFEVDEFWLDRVGPQLHPRALLLANLFRDQLDRYGELETIADRWAALVRSLPGGVRLALNADDPLIADLGRDRPDVTYFGVQDASMALAEMQHASDSKHCRRCGAAYVYDAVYLGHLGLYRCPSCGQQPARADGGRRADRARRHAGRQLPAAHAGRHGDRRAAAARSLQRLQRARRRHPVPGAGRLAGAGRRRAGGGQRRVRPGRADHDRRPRALDPADQEPGRSQRDPAHAGAGARASSTCSGSSTTAPPTAGTCRGSGTPTSSCWPTACAASPAPGRRAAELALRLQVRRRAPPIACT